MPLLRLQSQEKAGYNLGYELEYKERHVKTGKTIKPKSKAAKAPKLPVRKPQQGEAEGPDERRPEVKADEIYGDTKIPQRGGKK